MNGRVGSKKADFLLPRLPNTLLPWKEMPYAENTSQKK